MQQSLQWHADKIARANGLNPAIFRALVQQESGWNVHAGSGAGAQGLTQLMPATARGLGVRNVFNPLQNLRGGARYLAAQLHTFGGDYHKALAAYNAGPGAVQKYGGIPPYAETQNYVRAILGNAKGINVSGAGLGGAQRGRGARRTGMPGSTGSFTVPGVTGAANQPLGSTGIQTLLDALGQRKPMIQSVGLQAPQFAAQPTLAGGMSPISSGMPVPKQDTTALLDMIRTVGGNVTEAPGTPAINVKGFNGSGVRTPGGTLRGAGGQGGTFGRVTVAANANYPGRPINPAVIKFVRGIAGRFGAPLTIGTGTRHDRLTVNGSVSDHYSGNAADIPLTGRSLIRAGQDALIQAGMSPAQAHKITGGGFNVGNYQIIFNTDAPGWGNHLAHLHVGRRR